MNARLTIQEHPEDAELTRLFELTERNARWLNDHAQELGIFQHHRGRFIAASEGEIFVGDSSEIVEALAQEKHPHDVPHVQFIPLERSYRIYAC